MKYYIDRYLRRGKIFLKLIEHSIKNENLSYEELIDYQNLKLKSSVQQAYKEVAFYRKTFDDLQINPQDIQTIQDLQILPVLNKLSIQGQEDKFVSQALMWKLKTSTSGTTGTPVKLSRNLFSINFEHASIWRQRHWGKCFLDEPYVSLRGDIFISPQTLKPPFWKYIAPHNKLIMSSYHLSEQFIPDYLTKIRQFSPAFIEGYPSSIYRLARYMQLHKEPSIKVKAVFTSSETLPDYRRQAIEECFGQVYDHYGQAERVAHIAMCESGNYHYMMDYSLVEFLPTEEDNLYRVVGTTFHNRAMPLIRYDTGDFVRIKSDRKPCACKRAFPIIESIEGRLEDYISTPSGKYIGGMGTAFMGVLNLIEAQIIQEKLDLIRVLIVTANNFTDQDKKVLLKNIQQRVGHDIKIVIEETDAIPRTKRGKHKTTVSLLPNESI